MASERILWSEVAALGVLMGAVLFLWDTPAVYPLKILVVFFHELSHAAAALATGGSVIEIGVVAEEGGYCVTSGGNRFLTLSAGYLGSLAFGGIILVLAARGKFDRAVSGLLGALLIAVALWLVRPFFGFGFWFGIAAGAGLLAAASWLPAAANDFILKVVGLTSCLYAILDIKSDVLDRSSGPSDAALLADATHVPAYLWGLAWIAIAGASAVYFLRLACREKEPGKGAIPPRPPYVA